MNRVVTPSSAASTRSPMMSSQQRINDSPASVEAAMTQTSRPTFLQVFQRLQATGPARVVSSRGTPYLVTAEVTRRGQTIVGRPLTTGSHPRRLLGRRSHLPEDSRRWDLQRFPVDL
jgi:hypothetical protein